MRTENRIAQMTPLSFVPTGPIDRRDVLAVVLIGVYGTLVGSYVLMAGYARDPGWRRIEILQAGMLPVLVVTFYVTRRNHQRVVALLGLTPVLGVMLLYLIGLPLWWASWPPWPELLEELAALGVVMLAVSGSWAILGYLAGVVTLWGHDRTASKRRQVVSWRWVGFSSFVILASYLATYAVWVLHFGDVL